jgi:glycine dehydrogenase subunit 1
MSFVPHSENDRREMLKLVGVESARELYSDVPENLILDRDLDIPVALSEWEAVDRLEILAAENEHLVSFAGAGIYDHYIPAAVDHLILRSEFYTAYTPYQPEVAQGTLQVIYEFQSMICELTGMDVANASMYDGPSAAAEAAILARAATRRKEVVTAASLHPHYQKVIETYLSGQEVVPQPVARAEAGSLDSAVLASHLNDDTACVIVQQPNFFGLIEDLEPLAEQVHSAGALLVVVADPMALPILRSPGDCGADIVVAEGQPYGNTPNYGGPVVGLLKATSNICTNQGLNALAATIHIALLGRTGLREVAEVSAQNAHYAHRLLADAGVETIFPDSPFVREFAVRTDDPSREVLARGIERGVMAGVSLSRFPALDTGDGLLLAFTEKRSREEIHLLVDVIAG